MTPAYAESSAVLRWLLATAAAHTADFGVVAVVSADERIRRNAAALGLRVLPAGESL